jgi:guanylate kinase
LSDAVDREPFCLILSAPSGAGKTTLARCVIDRLGGIECTISCTTRRPRSDERDGVDYFFVDDEEFDRHIDGGDFLEWAAVHDHRYGTLRAEMERILRSGRDAMMVIDVQGAAAVRERIADLVTVFVLPPSREVLERRLEAREGRAEGSGAVGRQRRLRTAREEIARHVGYDYLVFNDDLDEAVDELQSIFVAERCRRSRRASRAATVLDSFRA